MQNLQLSDALKASTPGSSASNRIARFRPLLLAFPALLLVLPCTSCADLTAVASFATSAKNASTGYSDIVTDFAGSASRRSLLVSEDQKQTVLAQAQAYKDLEPDLLAAQKPLTDYIAALAAISTNTADTAGKSSAASGSSATSVGSTAKSSSTSAKSASLQKAGLTQSQATAAMGLATKVSAALTAAYRSDKTGKAIHDCNPELQDYLVGLEHIVGTDYPLALDVEKTSTEAYYSDLLHKYASTEPLAAMTVRLQEKQDIDAISKRKLAAAAYVKILTDIGEGHQKLADAGEKMTPKQLVTIIEPYASDIYTQSQSVAKAF